MSKKISTNKLVIVFAALLLIVLAVEYHEDDSQKGTFRQELVGINVDKVSYLKIITKAKNEIKLSKIDNEWKLELEENKLVNAGKSKVEQALDQLIVIKPFQLVANDPEKWKDFQVDTSGVRITVFEEENKKALDIILGRFSFKSKYEMYTYVRLADEDEVYSVEGLLDMSFNRQLDYWRNEVLIDDDSKNWSKIAYNYPADSSFTLINNEGKWKFELYEKVDTNKIDKYLSNLKYSNSSDFVDDIDTKELISPTLNLNITTTTGQVIEINAFAHAKYEWLFTSSENEGTVFSAKRGDNLFKDLFPGKSKFLFVEKEIVEKEST